MELVPILIVLFTLGLILLVEKMHHPVLQQIFDWLPPILLAYLIPALLAWMLGSDFSKSTLHALSSQFVVPFAVAMVMSTMTFEQLKIVGIRPIVLFFSGSLWIALFPIAYFYVSETMALAWIDAGVWKGVPPIVGSWIGGSTSQIVLKEIVQCPEDLFVAVLILDNILVNIWTVLMFQFIKKTPKINALLGTPDEVNINNNTFSRQETPLSGMGSLLVLSFLVILSSWLPLSFVQRIILLSVVGLLLPLVIKNWNYAFLLRYAQIPILLIMIILGLKLRFEQLYFNPGFILFLGIWLLGHFLFMLLVGKLLKLNSVWIPIASMANVGGISTAPAVTAAYDKRLMPHAIILAVLSMVSGTFWGGITIWLFYYFLGYR